MPIIKSTVLFTKDLILVHKPQTVNKTAELLLSFAKKIKTAKPFSDKSSLYRTKIIHSVNRNVRPYYLADEFKIVRNESNSEKT